MRLNDKKINGKEFFENYSINHELRQIKLVNALSVISFVCVLSFFVAYILMDVPELALRIKILIPCSIGTLLPIAFNYINKPLLAKIFVSIYNTFFMLLFVILFRADLTSGHVFFMTYALIPLFIWSVKDWLYIAAFFSINLICFITIEFFDFSYQYSIAPSVGAVDFFSSLTVLLCFLTAFVAVVVFHRIAHAKELLLATKNAQIEQQKEELVEVNKDLQKKILELELNQQELNHANSIKSKFFSIIAHDLRSPMGSIKGLSQVLAQDYDELTSEDVTNYINSIYNTSENTYVLLENLLDWSRLQTNRITLDYKSFNLLNTCTTAVGINSSAINKKNITIVNNIDKNLAVKADKYMVSTVLRNLVSNAIKYTPIKGNITISATTDNDMVKVSITDTGIGMNKEELSKLFDYEKSFTKPGTENENGTGLGLLICKEFIEKNGGELSVESVENFGSTFSFTLGVMRPDCYDK